MTTSRGAVPPSASDSVRWTEVSSPVGPLRLGVDGDVVARVHFAPIPGGRSAWTMPGVRVEQDADPLLAEVARQLDEYFAGRRADFDLPLDPRGRDFERRVWLRLLGIRYGDTVSYGEVARDVGEPGGAQAVGRAVGANPLAIVVPCHRVVGADGMMTGFGGGLDRKAYLLDLEGYVGGTTLLPPRYAGDDGVGGLVR